MVDSRVLPGKSIDVFIVELRMLLELVIVVDPRLAILVEYRRKWEVRS